ncbi:hypothetical protein JHL17_17900 [Azospirillum sp. YIM B02556]|uniref:Uncharacterized protein n=1 Tax=Azospirillum endophyticum TaxID=2800326 RepID=A0ABS1F794_9PROT|nr:hypothetical protein [Azospirillum endophyticum]MBK1839287.1 hypothetical protein [Azospirillum endophyticum]
MKAVLRLTTVFGVTGLRLAILAMVGAVTGVTPPVTANALRLPSVRP